MVEDYPPEPPGEPSKPMISGSLAAAAIMRPDEPKGSSGLFSGLSHWIPWRSGSAATGVRETSSGKSYAEGSLRDLLKTVDDPAMNGKGKGVER